jgi:hypothetical protein
LPVPQVQPTASHRTGVATARTPMTTSAPKRR